MECARTNVRWPISSCNQASMASRKSSFSSTSSTVVKSLMRPFEGTHDAVWLLRAKSGKTRSSLKGSAVRGDQAGADGEPHQPGDVADAQSIHDPRPVGLDRLDAQLQGGGDLL